MDKSVNQALNSLLPALAELVPPELQDLATSILAQSRSKAGSLKAEEEIARTYACANLACERLKQRLGLPKIQPRPPCPPRVYLKLYEYLASALPVPTRKGTTPKKPPSQPYPSSTEPRTPIRVANGRRNVPRRAASQKTVATAYQVPEWIMPVIRQLCKRMKTLAAPHHVFAGVSSILSSQPSENREQAGGMNILALLVITYSLVTTRLSGIKQQPAEYERQNDLAVDILKDAAGDHLQDVDVNSAELDRCMEQFRVQRWTYMDWFSNIPIGAGVGSDQGFEDVVVEDRDGHVDDDEMRLPAIPEQSDKKGKAGHAYLQAGLGTMMQERVDYLSESRRQEYQDWKKGILAQIEELERAEEINDPG